MFLTKIIRLNYKLVLKPILFRKDPEDVHDMFLILGKRLGQSKTLSWLTRVLFYYKSDILTQDILGVKFENPIGLAAGFDKDANIVKTISNVGFGFIEVGSITLKPYEGNPRPRLYRLVYNKALVVFYGLKNEGVKVIVARLKKYSQDVKDFPVGISIARTNSKEASSLEAGIEDYKQCLEFVAKEEVGDYITINISCPNTYFGEPYTTPDKLEKLLNVLSQVKTSKPVFIKMPINLPWKEFRLLLEIIIKYKYKGVIIGNLNKDKESKYITQKYPDNMKGGVSGVPTRELSNELIRQTYNTFKDKLIIVGVGGIDSVESAYEKITLGASLLQLITGMVYNGPQLIGEINQGLTKILEKEGYKNISEAVGSKALK